MRVKLLRQNRIDGRAGEIVEVSPARAAFLFQMKLAVPAPVRERIETPEKAEARKTPEAAGTRETPEKKTARRTTRKK